MDASKINQAELKYSCGAGKANLNLYTGRLVFECYDCGIGKDSYRIDLSHIYNSKMPNNIKTFLGNKWKFSVQQFLYVNSNGIYVYVDAAGMTHEFSKLFEDKYYDVDGMGLILEVKNNQIYITDEGNNKMYFENNRLTKYVSGYNNSIENSTFSSETNI